VTAPIVSEFQVSGNQQFALRAAVLARKSMFTHAALGGLLGGLLGIVGGLARPSRGAWPVFPALAGLLLGGVAGGASARGLVPWFVRNEKPLSDDMILPLLTHGGIAVAIGLAAGAALGLGRIGTRSGMLRGALGGLFGGALAAAIHEPAAALLFPLDQTGQPLASGVGSRLMALLLPAATIAVVAAMTVSAQPRARSTPPPGASA
jgi:hypothetical protein